MTAPWWASSRQHQSVKGSGSLIGRDSVTASFRDDSQRNVNQIVNNVKSGYTLDEIEAFANKRAEQVSNDYARVLEDLDDDRRQLGERLDAAGTDYALLLDERDELNERLRGVRRWNGRRLAAVAAIAAAAVVLGPVLASLVSSSGSSTVVDSAATSGSAAGNQHSAVQAAHDYVGAAQRHDWQALRALQSDAFLGPDADAQAAEIARFWAGYELVTLFDEPRIHDRVGDATWVAVPLVFIDEDHEAAYEWVYWSFGSSGELLESGRSGGGCEGANIRTCEPSGEPRR